MKLSNLATITALIYELIEVGELIFWKYIFLVKNAVFKLWNTVVEFSKLACLVKSLKKEGSLGGN